MPSLVPAYLRPLRRMPVTGLFVLLGLSLLVCFTQNVLLGIVLFVFGLMLLGRPFEPFLCAVLTAAAATFVKNEGGHTRRDLGVVGLVAMMTLAGWYVAATTGRWKLPRGGLTAALLVLAATTAFAAARGVLSHYELRFVILELAPLSLLALTLLVGGLRMRARDTSLALSIFIIAALLHVGIGFYSYAVNRVRTGGIFFTPIPGMMATLLLNLVLHGESRSRLVLKLLIVLFLLQQLISFTRGYWMGILVAFPFSFLLYAGFGPGALKRWRRLAGLTATFALLLLVGVLAVSLWFGWSDILTTLGTRLASSVETERTSDTASNIERLVEYGAAWRSIVAAPWLGYGLGYSLRVEQPIYQITTSQWFVHEAYLMIWLKQGLIGLLALLGVLVAAVRVGFKGASKLTGEARGWCLGAAAATLYLATFGLTNFPFTIVNSPTLLAVLWGIAFSLTLPDRYLFVWDREAIEPGAVRLAP